MDKIDFARFWSRVDVQSVHRCWPWHGALDSNGYGVCKIGGKTTGAHRIALAFMIGEDAIAGAVVRHTCDKPACCNPHHLTAGTHTENVLDRVARDRSAQGIRNGRHKLTEQDVKLIRLRNDPARSLASLFGVHVDTINDARRGKTWRHLGRDPDATQPEARLAAEASELAETGAPGGTRTQPTF